MRGSETPGGETVPACELSRLTTHKGINLREFFISPSFDARLVSGVSLRALPYASQNPTVQIPRRAARDSSKRGPLIAL